MQSPKCLVCSIVAVLIGSGCASTEMHSFVDPDFHEATFGKVMVKVQVDKLDQRDHAETIFAKAFEKSGASVVRALDILPPTRKFEGEQFDQMLKNAKIDGVLLIDVIEYYEDEYYVPQSSTTHTTGRLSSNTYYSGNRRNTYGTHRSTSNTMTSGGYTYTKPRIRHEAQLWDVESGKMAWVGGTFTKGNQYAGFRDLMSALAKSIRTTFEEEGLVAPAPKR